MTWSVDVLLLQADEASCFIQQASYLLYDTNDNDNSNYIYLTLLYVGIY